MPRTTLSLHKVRVSPWRKKDAASIETIDGSHLLARFAAYCDSQKNPAEPLVDRRTSMYTRVESVIPHGHSVTIVAK